MIPPPEQFCHLGERTAIAHSCDFLGTQGMWIGDDVYIGADCWILDPIHNPQVPFYAAPKITIGNGCSIGRRSVISAINKVVIGERVLFGPNVFVSDHNHAYHLINLPIMHQGVDSITSSVIIQPWSWICYNAVVVGNVTIGQGSVVGANSVVNKDVPNHCVVAGQPARIIKIYDYRTGIWVDISDQQQAAELLESRYG